MNAAITQEDYGNYLIKSGRLSGTYVARAFPKPPVKKKGLIAEASGKSEEAAIEALKIMIEERDAERTASRRWEVRSGLSVPTEAEFEEAIDQTSLSTAQIAMLVAHAVSGEAGLLPNAMASAAGYKSVETAEKTYKRAGTALAAYLGIDLDGGDTPTGDGPARLLAYRERLKDSDDAQVWVMHPELRTAVLETL